MTTTSLCEFHGFRDAKTGELVRLEESNTGWRLTRNSEHPVFEVPSSYALSKTLLKDTFWVNSTAQCPSWGEFQQHELLPVLVQVTTQTHPVELEPFFQGSVLDERRTLVKVANLYASEPIEVVSNDELHLWVVELGEAETLEALRQRHVVQGQLLNLEYYSVRVYCVRDVPEELHAPIPGKHLALLIVSQPLVHP